ncbi:DUF3413 domain-containing protein [Pseudoalteromonas sp. T1lg65]|uniref:DUF3413 domain-containing protein n=1 Tax=Pseudoalteromonas sp. T1lg65 TaxID=2077101 RepID=UPI003F7A6A65
MNLTPQSPFSSKASQLLSWGHWFTFANIGLILLISSVYLFADKAPSTAVGWFYMVITWLSHTSFIAFCAFVLTIFPVSLVFPYPRHIRGMAAVVATLGVGMLAVDAAVYFKFGYHINIESLPEIMSLFWQTAASNTIITLLLVIAIILAVLIFELLAGNYAWRHLEKLKSFRFPRYATASIVTCFALSHTLHIWADANAFFDITKQDNVLPLSYPTTAKKLLARHDLLDLDQYQQAHSIDVNTSSRPGYQAPFVSAQCRPQAEPVNIYIFDDSASFAHQAKQLDFSSYRLESILRSGDSTESLFNLLYGLPSFYMASIVANSQTPVWSFGNDLLNTRNLDDFSFIQSSEDASIQVFQGTQTTAIDKKSNYILLELNDLDEVIVKSAMVTNIELFSGKVGLLQPSDIIFTLLASHFGCKTLATETMIAADVTTRSHAEGVNFIDGVLVAYKKDKITLVNQDGSFKQISAKEGFVVDGKLDVPFLVQNIKVLKKFAQQPSK